VQVAERELNEALPILKAAEDNINAMRKHILPGMAELKSFKNPPQAVSLIASALMILYHDGHVEHDWAKAMARMSDANFAIEVHDYDINSMTLEQVARLGNELNAIASEYVVGHSNHDGVYSSLRRVSIAVATVYLFLYHCHTYGSLTHQLDPMRALIEEKMIAMQREIALQEKADLMAAKEVEAKRLRLDEVRGVSRAMASQVATGMDASEGISEPDLSAMRRERALQDYRNTLRCQSDSLHSSGIFSSKQADRAEALNNTNKEAMTCTPLTPVSH
jgi:hypothetical protein